MDDLYTAGTSRTLDVDFKASSGVLNLKGSSYSENAIDFFNPLLAWIAQYSSNPMPHTIVNFTVEYAATSSVKYILELLKSIEQIAENGSVEINWHYFEVDEDIYELGEDYAAIVDIPFNFKALSLLPDMEILKQLKYETGSDFFQGDNLEQLKNYRGNAFLLNSDKKLTALSLFNSTLRFFPVEVFELKELEFLSVVNCQLKKIPKDIVDLANLKGLVLKGNRMKDLPRELFELPIDWTNDCEIEEPFLKTPPSEVIKQGKAAIDLYFKEQAL